MSARNHRILTEGQRLLLERLGAEGQVYACPRGFVLWSPWTAPLRLTEATMTSLLEEGQLRVVAEYGADRRLYQRKEP